MFSKRDLKGYGSNTPNPRWPRGAKIAISFVVNYEEGGENTPDNGDPHTETFLNETPGGVAQTQRDMNMETQYEYGSRVGVWRIMNLFQEKGWKFTCYAVGRAVELNPEPIKAMHAAGHEIASHNYRWINYGNLTESEERDHVRRCILALRAATNQKAPVGWYTGRISPRSREIVLQEYQALGLPPLLYDSDAYNDDLPYYLQGGHLVIPYTLDANDMKFCVGPGFTAPSGFFEYLKNTFDILRAEGLTGHPKMMNVGLHCRLVGKPGRTAALKQFMDYVATFDDVWVCTREEIARHWRREFPFGQEKSSL